MFYPPTTLEQSALDDANYQIEFKAYSKTRQKMHEIAVKRKLITEQDPQSYGFLQLSSEEKRALLQEGYKLPTVLPLTKSETEALKVLSAQESRRKRKEYMNELEKRVHYYGIENSTLKLKLKDLEERNHNLIEELRSLKRCAEFNYEAECHPSCPTNATTTTN
uniref:BZIP domain-containing protein n=1 Tax=Setaria digitata TaxID=48799 RepID=A0A915PZC4_9BILA